MAESTLDRIKQFIDYKGITIRAFEISVSMSNGSFASQLKNNKTIGVDKLENILNIYPDVNPEWLLTGKGKMLKTGPVIYKEAEEQVHIIAEDAAVYKTELKNREEVIELQKFKIKTLEEKLTRTQNAILDVTKENISLKEQLSGIKKENTNLKKETDSKTGNRNITEKQTKLAKTS